MSATAGEMLADELAARQWTPSHMAALCGLPEQAITAMIAGGPIAPSVAERIGQALGTSAQMWLALDAPDGARAWCRTIWSLRRNRAQPLPYGPTGAVGHITGAHMPRLETLDPARYSAHPQQVGDPDR